MKKLFAMTLVAGILGLTTGCPATDTAPAKSPSTTKAPPAKTDPSKMDTKAPAGAKETKMEEKKKDEAPAAKTEPKKEDAKKDDKGDKKDDKKDK